MNDKCPHGIPKPFHHLDLRNMTLLYQSIYINSEDCPGCLKVWISNLRTAFSTLLKAMPPEPYEYDENYKQRRSNFDNAYQLFINDLCESLGPDFTS